MASPKQARRGAPQRAPLNLAVRRAKTGVRLEQIAEDSKISIRFLRAIENEEFEKLPGGVFTTSYLRQYAAAIGIEPGELLEAARRIMPGDATSKPPESERAAPARGLWRMASNLIRNL